MDVYLLLALVNGVAYFGGGVIASLRLAGGRDSVWPRRARLLYRFLIFVWLWIGSGYLLLAIGLIGVPELIQINRPLVWATAIPGWFGYFVMDHARDRALARAHQLELDRLTSAVRQLEDRGPDAAGS